MKRNVLLLLLFSASIVAFSGPVKKKKNQQPKVYTDFPKDELQCLNCCIFWPSEKEPTT